MKYVSLFTGVGGFDLGLDRAGMECVLQVEQDKYALRVLRRHWGSVPKMEDVRDVKADVAGGVDLIAGGFPCQDCSTANARSRKGLDGERSGLWYEFRRILEEARPEWCVIENVPGLLTSNGGRDFATVLQGLEELRYGTVWRTLDSRYFGVPQRRRRLFIVGHLGDGRAAEVLFERESLCRDTAKGKQEREGHPREAEECFNPSSPQAERVRTVDGCSSTLVSNSGGMGAKTGLYLVPDTCGTLTSRWSRGFNGQDAYTDHLVPTTYALQENMIGRKHHNGPAGSGVKEEQSFTLTSAGPHGVSVGQTVRRLTPTECCRLQGFPDDWNDWLSDAQRYKQMGNAVTVPVAKWIGERMCQHSGS